MKDSNINLDLINMVQNARMAHDKDAKPSQVPGVYWIEVKPQQGKIKPPTARTGEWQIATTLDAVDDLWAIVKQATEQGQLGYKSKVSTRPAHGQSDDDARLICVRTYDADDREDVERIKQALIERGITPMQYQRDHE